MYGIHLVSKLGLTSNSIAGVRYLTLSCVNIKKKKTQHMVILVTKEITPERYIYMCVYISVACNHHIPCVDGCKIIIVASRLNT